MIFGCRGGDYKVGCCPLPEIDSMSTNLYCKLGKFFNCFDFSAQKF
jgi:hypothetical protein